MFLKAVDIPTYSHFFRDNKEALKLVKMNIRGLQKAYKSKNMTLSNSHDLTVNEGSSPVVESSYPFDIPEAETIYTVLAKPPHFDDYYNFTYMAMALNEIEEGMVVPDTLCPTDSRLRPDVQYLENGRLEEADEWKEYLETKQRERNTLGTSILPRWFSLKKNEYTNSIEWTYNGGYWDRNYGPDVLERDLFG